MKWIDAARQHWRMFQRDFLRFVAADRRGFRLAGPVLYVLALPGMLVMTAFGRHHGR